MLLLLLFSNRNEDKVYLKKNEYEMRSVTRWYGMVLLIYWKVSKFPEKMLIAFFFFEKKKGQRVDDKVLKTYKKTADLPQKKVYKFHAVIH